MAINCFCHLRRKLPNSCNTTNIGNFGIRSHHALVTFRIRFCHFTGILKPHGI